MFWIFSALLFLGLSSCQSYKQQDYSLFDQKMSEPSQIAYIAKNTSIEKGLELYLHHLEQTKEHNFSSLRSMANAILLSGLESQDPKIQIMTLFAAKIAKAEHLTYNLAKLLKSPYFEVQQTALDTLSTFENEKAIQAIFQAFSSDFLFTRLQAAYVLADQKRLNALPQIEALMHKSPPEIKPYFCELFAKVGGGYGMQILQNALTDPNTLVKAQAMIHGSLNHREEVKGPILQAATHTSPIEQESAAFAMGVMEVEEGIPLLKELEKSSFPFVRLTAANSLYQLGQLSSFETIKQLAEKEDLFALGLLGHIHEAKALLFEKLASQELNVRVNATLSLLEQKEEIPLHNLLEALTLNYQGYAYSLSFSSAHTLRAIKTIPNYEVLSIENPSVWGLNHSIRMMLMQLSYQLSEEFFLKVAEFVLEKKYDELIPVTCVMLENLQTDKAKKILEKSSQAIGYPLLRGSAFLSLYRMTKDDFFAQSLKQFIQKELEKSMLELRALFFGELKPEKKRFELTAEERTNLILESLYTLAEEEKEVVITLLIQGLKTTDEQNRFLLAGLILSLL